MGNNNSNYGSGHVSSSKSRHLPHDYQHRGHGKWGASSSDLGESSGNRMKKGYLPTRGYHGHHSRLPSPHKVLPSVNPTSAAKLLKPTSNGAILHQGGTISGRKLLSELDPHSPEAEDLRRAMRKRSTASMPGNGDMLNSASGRSTPNLSIMEFNGGGMERNGPRRASSKGSSRDYDSEPDMSIHDHRDDSSPQRSISPVPNSFTLIQESPAKKQIRTKKKGKAPPPPMMSPGDHSQMFRVGGSDVMMACCSPHSPQLLSPCGESKKASRLFKTKAESRLAAGPRSPEICSDLEMSRGGVMRASMDANRFFRGDRDRSSLHSAVEASLSSNKQSSSSQQMHLSNRKHSEGGGGVMLRKTSLGSAMLNMNKNYNGEGGGLSSRNNPEVNKSNKMMMATPLGRDHASASSSLNPSAPLNKIIPTSRDVAINNVDEHVPKSHRVSSSSILPPITPYGQSSSSSNNINNSGGGKPSVNHQQKVSNANNKGGFISSSSSQTKTAALHHQTSNNSSSSNNSKPLIPNGKVGGGNGKATAITTTTTSNNNVHHGRRKTTAAPAVPTTTSNGPTTAKNNDADSNNKTKQFYFGMDTQPTNKQKQTVATVHQQSDSDNNNNECRLLPSEKMNDRMLINHLEKVSSTNSYELMQIKQEHKNDSGSFDTSEKATGNNVNVSHLQRESSSELSSSDLDIPLNIRPTLPAKKLGLPRFSPTAAWRALDSPSRVSVSGRSYSSEEGYGHDRIQRYMRQIPPSRANHERSAADSGISAGDAGSPANQELIGDQSTTNTPSCSNPPVPPPVISSNGVGGRNYKLRDHRSSSGTKHNGINRDVAKCWTPEQDLDESSSSEEFDDTHQLSPSNHHLPHLPVPGSHPLHHSSSNVATRVLPAGLGTPPKLTTRNNLFERGGRNSSALGMVSDSDQYHLDRPGNLYVRSRKVMNGDSGNSGGAVNDSSDAIGATNNRQKTHEEIKKSQVSGASRYYRNFRSQPWRQPNQLQHPSGSNNGNSGGAGSREFVGLDTNWFLSRSEPNSLNLIGSGEYDNIEQQELRISLAEPDDDEEDDNEGDVDDDLYLPNAGNNNNKQKSSTTITMSMNGGNNGGKNHVVNNEYDEVDSCGVGGIPSSSTRLESEIGYGPSSMSFSSPLPSPSAVKINRNKVNSRGQMSNNNKDPPRQSQRHYHHRQQLVSSTTLLAEEFERDQNNAENMLASPSGNSNVRYGDNSWERKPFSHIMYLPAYDSRRVPSSAGTRRTKSVDNLNFSEMTVYQPRKTSQYTSPVSPIVKGDAHMHNGSSAMARQQQDRRSRSPSNQRHQQHHVGRGRRMVKRSDQEEPYERSQSVPPFTAEEENEHRQRALLDQKMMKQQREQERAAALEREQKKKKFKFQSTLRVMERKKIEEELSRDAEEKERQRLHEHEQMRKVEEEFQRKRVREKVLEMEAAAAAAASNNGNNSYKTGKASDSPPRLDHHLDHSNMEKIEATNRYDVSFEPRNNSADRNYRNESGRSSNISYTTTTMSNNHHQALFQRQEPEGAPASATNGVVGDLRKELISASRNRNAFPGERGKHSELTQELSEFCTPTGQRQYFDYRRAHHHHDGGDGYHLRSGPTTRYYHSSSSSDIFPVANRRDRRKGGGGSSIISSSKSSVGYLRPTVHPEVVCDIPVKPLPYVVNFSRLSSSNMDLLTESERPRSGLGGNASVLSDNYRKDWAHHVSRGNGPARASSVMSLNSVIPSSHLENFRHSSVDLTGGSQLHTPPHSPRQSKYSTSPSTSPVSHSRPLSSPEERGYPNHSGDVHRSKYRAPSTGQEMWNGDCVTGNKTVVMLNAPPPSSSPIPYQPAPAPFNRQKAFRPVDFNPTSNSSSGGLSPAHAFHHASAKLTTPPVN